MKTVTPLNRYLPAAAIPLLLILIASCSNPAIQAPGTGMDEPGSVLVRLGGSDADRSAAPESWKEQVDRFELVLSGDQAMGPIFFPDNEILLEDLPSGIYTFSVTASDSGGTVLAAGSLSDFEITGEDAQEADVLLQPVMGGSGEITIRYDWSDAGFSPGYITHIIATITPAGGTPRPVTLEIGEDGFVHGEELPTGTYTFSCEMYADGRLVATMTEELQVFDGLETETVKNLGPWEFEAVPRSPSPRPAEQDGLDVIISWDDTGEQETGYRVYRSTDGGDYVLVGEGIPANETSWTDSPVEPGDYVYLVTAVNEFGESDAAESVVIVNALVEPAVEPVRIEDNVIIGSDGNQIPFSLLTAGFTNNLNRASLDIVEVTVSRGNARISGDSVIIDVEELPFESEGQEIILEYTVQIAGQPRNSTYSTNGTAVIVLQAPEVEEVAEEDLLNPVTAFVFDNRDDLNRKTRTYEPPDSEQIFESWGRVLGPDFFTDGGEAETETGEKGDNADLALWWKLKQSGGESYIEYAKNSVYAGFVSPGGRESDSFTLEATVSSKDGDDDTLGLIVAYVRENGVNYVLEAARSHGAESGGVSIEPSTGWGLLVRRLESGGSELGEVIWSRQLDAGGISSRGWSGAECRIRVVRDGDNITVRTTDWDDTGSYLPGSDISVSLDTASELRRFRGAAGYGYFVASQERSSFRDIVIDAGYVEDKLFLLDTETGESEVWWYDTTAGRWIPVAGATIQDTLGYPVEVTNPDTGETYLVERKRFRRGSWRELWRRWSSWRDWNNRGSREDDDEDDDD